MHRCIKRGNQEVLWRIGVIGIAAVFEELENYDIGTTLTKVFMAKVYRHRYHESRTHMYHIKQLK